MANLNYYIGPWAVSKEVGSWVAPTGTVGLVDLRPVSPTQTYGFFAVDGELESAYELVGVGDLREVYPDASARSAWETCIGVKTEATHTLLDMLWLTLTEGADPLGETRAKPIMPTHKGVLELHLAGHSLVRSLPVSKATAACREKLLTVAKVDIELESKLSVLTAEKYLYCMARKLGVDSKSLVSKESLLTERKPETSYSDDFNRASLGDGWTAVKGTWGMSSNQLACTTGSTSDNAFCRYESDLSSSDHFASVLVTNTIRQPGPAARTASDSTVRYAAFCKNDGYSGILKYNSSNARTDIGSGSGARTGNYTVTLTCDGSTISFTVVDGVNDDISASVTDTTISSGVRCGVNLRDIQTVYYDNFYCEDLVAATSILPFMMRYHNV